VRFFIAGRWSDRNRVRELIYAARERGHEVTHDWTIKDVPDKSFVELQECALNDLDGVRRCDAFVFLADQEFQFRGAYTELGAAIALGKPVFIIGSCADKNIYVHHPLVRKVGSLMEVFEIVDGGKGES